jgi:hypothetical protein
MSQFQHHTVLATKQYDEIYTLRKKRRIILTQLFPSQITTGVIRVEIVQRPIFEGVKYYDILVILTRIRRGKSKKTLTMTQEIVYAS